MTPRLVVPFVLGMCISSSVTSAQVPPSGSAGVDPSTRASVALVVDPQGLEWCDGAICFRIVHVLGVIRNRTSYDVPHELTIMHSRGTPSLATAFLFLRMSCATGKPIWDVLPANQPFDQHEPRLLTTFGRVQIGSGRWSLQHARAEHRRTRMIQAGGGCTDDRRRYTANAHDELEHITRRPCRTCARSRHIGDRLRGLLSVRDWRSACRATRAG